MKLTVRPREASTADAPRWVPLTLRHLVVELDGVEVRGLHGLRLDLEDHCRPTVALSITVDEVDVDVDALAALEAHVDGQRRRVPRPL